MKFIALKYGVSNSTVIAAYKALVARKQAVKIGRRFFAGTMVHAPQLTKRKRAIIFCNQSLAVSCTNLGVSVGIIQSFREMETVLSGNGYRVEYRDISLVDLSTRQAGPSLAEPDGFVFVDVHAQNSKAIIEWYDKFKQYLGGRPIAMLLVCRRHFPFRRANVKRILPSNMVTTVYRRTAEYITAHCAETVNIFYNARKPVLHRRAVHIKLRTELKHLKPNIRIACIVIPPAKGATREEYFRDYYFRGPDPHVHGILDKYDYSSEDRALYEELVCTENFRDAFGQLSLPSVWIFTTMDEAADAVGWAREHSIDIPKKLSIISLDDDAAKSSENITCITEDWAHIGYLMAHAVINDIPLAKTSKGYIQPRARLVVRATA